MTSSTDLDPTAVVGRRCAQFVLDELLVIVPAIVLGALAVLMFAPAEPRALVEFTTVLLGVLFPLVFLGFLTVFVWWPYRHAGRTPAMHWLGLRIVTRSGSAPALSTLFLRMLLMVVDGFLWGLVGVVIMLTSKRHQRLGDMVASTTVVRAQPPAR